MSQYESNDDNGGYDDSRDDNGSDDYYKSMTVTDVNPIITGYSDNSWDNNSSDNYYKSIPVTGINPTTPVTGVNPITGIYNNNGWDNLTGTHWDDVLKNPQYQHNLTEMFDEEYYRNTNPDINVAISQ